MVKFIIGVFIGFILLTSLLVNFFFVYSLKKYKVEIYQPIGKREQRIDYFEFYSYKPPKEMAKIDSSWYDEAFIFNGKKIKMMSIDFMLQLTNGQHYFITSEKVFK